ncbi:MAG: serine/threonine-protein phosphatase [bacterium]|nr:serine/threonine-protein phosphatase [bacterium]
MELTCHFASGQTAGDRPTMEDRCASAGDEYGQIWVVADGLGGHSGGARAAEFVCGRIISLWRAADAGGRGDLPTLVSATASELAGANASLHRTERGYSTCVVATWEAASGLIRVCGVGDTRCYHVTDGAIELCTRDDTVAFRFAHEIGTEPGVRAHPDRNSLLRAMGSEMTGEPPKMQILQLDDRRQGLLICTDGIWEHVLDGEIALDLLKSPEASDWVAFLLRRAANAGANDRDNATAVGIIWAPLT